MFSIGVLVSGNGTNLQHIMNKIEAGTIHAGIKTVISDRNGAYAIQRAKKAHIDATVFNRKKYGDKVSDAILEKVSDYDLIVLAGFLSILRGKILDVFKNRIINVHPSLIPAFCGKGMYGMRVHKAALKRGVKVSGCTVHIVDAGTDTGTILNQKCVSVDKGETPDSLAEKIHPLEHEALAEVIEDYSMGKINPNEL